MPRRRRYCRMGVPPVDKIGWNPVSGSQHEEVVLLNYEEYETIRLNDYEGLCQEEGAVRMNISRPTYTRIYSSARKKVAKSLVENKSLLMRSGKVYFDRRWYHCKNCGCWFDRLNTEEEVKNCELCGSADIESYGSPDVKIEGSPGIQ